MVSRSDTGRHRGHNARPAVFFPQHIHSRQATLHTAHDSVHRLAGSYLARTRSGFQQMEFSTSSHNTRSPRKPGRMPHAIGARPGSLTPSIHPKLGVTSRHKGLHRCALHRIFRPYLEEGAPTRILHRRKHDSIYFLHIQVLFHFLYKFPKQRAGRKFSLL